MSRRRVLVTGATGYVGGRVVPQLLAAGHDVTVFVRTPSKLLDVPWRERVTSRQGSLDDAAPTSDALQGIDVALYLVHSMSAGGAFERADLLRHRLDGDGEHAGELADGRVAGDQPVHDGAANGVGQGGERLRHLGARQHVNSKADALVTVNTPGSACASPALGVPRGFTRLAGRAPTLCQ